MPHGTPMSGRNRRNRRLAELMVAGGLLTRREAEAALRLARRDNRRLVDVLLRSGRIGAFQLPALRRLELLGRSDATTAEASRIARQITHQAPPRRLATAAVGAAVMLGGLGLAHKAASKPQPAAPRAPLLRPQPGVDLRFASLDDVDAELERLQRRRRLRRPMPETLPPAARERAAQYRPLVEQYAAQHGLPPALVFAIIEQESSFDPRAQSHANAVGLMQIVPEGGGRAAYRHLRHAHELPSTEELRNPETNIRLGTLYLRLLLDQYFQDVQDKELRTDVALAAYNWGPGNVREALDTAGMPASVQAFQLLLEERAPAETRRYVRSIRRRMSAYS